VTTAASDRLALGLRRRLPALLQTEAAECGLACLAMIASYHGHCVDVATLRRRFTISAKGTTLSSIIDFASRLELSARPIRLEIEDLGRLRLPCILHWNFTHFVVLARVDRKRITIHDPAAGARSMESRSSSGRRRISSSASSGPQYAFAISSAVWTVPAPRSRRFSASAQCWKGS
jgi:hypothetical protein